METVQKDVPEMTETAADHYDRIRSVLRYIADHLDDGLQLDMLAGIACYSPYHFHRIFTAFVGEPVASYVRRKRLEEAARRIVQTDRKITEIALSAGFETPTAFTKAFKRHFRITPSELRASGYLSPVSQCLQPFYLPSYEVVMTPEIRAFDQFTIVQATAKGFANHTYTDAAQRAFARLQHYFRKHDLWPATGRCLGITPDDLSVVPHEECRFQASLELKEDRQTPEEEGIERVEFNPGRCAVFLHRGPYDTLSKTWNSAYRDWMPQSGEELRHAPPFEIYLNDPAHTEPDDLVTEICIPIQ